jgi:hypothetical protein
MVYIHDGLERKSHTTYYNEEVPLQLKLHGLALLIIYGSITRTDDATQHTYTQLGTFHCS